MKIDIKLDKRVLREKGYPIISIFVSKNDRLYPVTDYYAFENEWDEERKEPKKNTLYISDCTNIFFNLN